MSEDPFDLSAAGAQRGLRALVVEDDHAWQEIVGELLEDMGLAVDRAGCYEDAVACLRGATYRLAVVDLSLCGASFENRDGLRVLEAVQAYAPGCAAILLTGFATVDLAVAAMTEYGAYTCWRKENFRRSQFREALQRILAAAPAPGPAAPQPEPAASGTIPAPPEAGGGTALALVVENDAGWRSILSELLEELGYRARPCLSYGEALGYLLREPVAVAVVDLSLASSIAPDGNRDGYEVLRSTAAAGIPSIVVSGLATADEVRQVYADYGILAYLEKQGFDRGAFRQAVAAAAAIASKAAPPTAVERQAAEAVARLTPRELQVLALLVQGLPNKGIAMTLVLSTNTVKRYLKSIFEKLEVNSRSAAVAKAMAAGVRATAQGRARHDN